ncbi:MAG: chlorite dismutase family protein [Candidatus Promineifilaceae bacterium]
MSVDDLELVDIRERGRAADGSPVSFNRRLFMQLLAYGGRQDVAPLAAALEQAQIASVLYADLNDPRGIALLTLSEEPDYFLDRLHRFLKQPPFSQLTPKPEYTMLGRTYALGYEPDLEQALITRPRQRLLNPAWPWAIWYPLRRAGSFEQLSASEQWVILEEHGGVGRAFGKAGLAYDIRLACHGLDKNDNDFVIGLVGPQLHPLSAIVQRMRKTKQTSLHLERLGPFFVGKALWQSPTDGETRRE